MTRRNISFKERAWLTSQLDSWKSDGIISDDQSTRILDLYETPSELADRGRSALLLVLTSVAAFLIGLAVLLLIGYNWEAMPAALKLLIIFTVLIATHAYGFYLRFVRQLHARSDVVFFLGCIFFGAAIFLIAQIFHLSGHSPDTVWWWAIGVLPFALCLESVVLHMLFVALMAIWCGIEIFGFPDLGLWFWGRWGHIPNGAYSLLLLVIPGIVWAYRRASLTVVALYVLLLSWWAIIQPVAWQLDELTLFFIGAFAGLLLIIGGSHPRGSRMDQPYNMIGVLLMGGVLVALGMHWVNQEIFGRNSFIFGRANNRGIGSALGQAGSWALLLAGVIVSLGILYLASKLRADESFAAIPPHIRMWRTARRQWLPVALVSLMLFLAAWWCLGGGPLLPTLLTNVAIVALSFWLIFTGLHEDIGRRFAAGVVYLLLWAVMRYIDLFGDVGGMLGAAGIFLLCGLALFGVAWFWRHRKEVQHG